MYKKYLKRIIDITISFIGIIVLFIPMIIISIAIKLNSKGPVVFKQQRLGKNQKLFTIYKFRTMVINAYKIGGTNTYSDDPRITKVGTFLRISSLDEILQLFNILKGDMSIIGPRPILPEEFYEYKSNEKYSKRFLILPGLFCTVDLKYRATASRMLQFEMDAQYSDDISFLSDLKMFFSAVKTVLLGKNVYKDPDISEEKSSDVIEKEYIHK